MQFIDKRLVAMTFGSFQLERVKVVEKEKDELEGAKNEAVEYLALENEITKLTNCLYQKYM